METVSEIIFQSSEDTGVEMRALEAWSVFGQDARWVCTGETGESTPAWEQKWTWVRTHPLLQTHNQGSAARTWSSAAAVAFWSCPVRGHMAGPRCALVNQASGAGRPREGRELGGVSLAEGIPELQAESHAPRAGQWDGGLEDSVPQRRRGAGPQPPFWLRPGWAGLWGTGNAHPALLPGPMPV